jgi:DNA helicase-2/ATP-dependent DNA helicase PcrA
VLGAKNLKCFLKIFIDEYVSTIEKALIPKKHFKIGNRIVFTYKEINHLFLNEYRMWPVMQRLERDKKNLTNRLKTRKASIINDGCMMHAT